jgi:hypothetical protein
MAKQTPDFETLIDQLRRAPDVFDRVRAASALSDCLDIRVVFALIEALRAASSMHLGTTAEGIPVTLHLYGPGDIRTAAASSLTHLAPQLRDRRAVEPLLAALQDRDDFVQEVAFITLSELSAELQDGTAVEALLEVQPEIERKSAGRAIVTVRGQPRSARDGVILLLRSFREAGRSDLLLLALKSKDDRVSMFAAKALVEMGKAKDAIDAVIHASVSKPACDEIFSNLERTDSELALLGLIRILKEATPRMRVCAADRLRTNAHPRAIGTLSEWQAFLAEQCSHKVPGCPTCGRQPSQQLQDGNYWCSWCGDAFTSGAAWAADEERSA